MGQPNGPLDLGTPSWAGCWCRKACCGSHFNAASSLRRPCSAETISPADAASSPASSASTPSGATKPTGSAGPKPTRWRSRCLQILRRLERESSGCGKWQSVHNMPSRHPRAVLWYLHATQSFRCRAEPMLRRSPSTRGTDKMSERASCRGTVLGPSLMFAFPSPSEYSGSEPTSVLLASSDVSSANTAGHSPFDASDLSSDMLRATIAAVPWPRDEGDDASDFSSNMSMDSIMVTTDEAATVLASVALPEPAERVEAEGATAAPQAPASSVWGPAARMAASHGGGGGGFSEGGSIQRLGCVRCGSTPNLPTTVPSATASDPASLRFAWTRGGCMLASSPASLPLVETWAGEETFAAAGIPLGSSGFGRSRSEGLAAHLLPEGVPPDFFEPN
mmetsp:Transcript_106338/g.317818  ORF Transcript_106338/g.317818 Transcript_106338/m.317818 type:complete len:392 (-) Transcript_106338:48-1223(-)